MERGPLALVEAGEEVVLELDSEGAQLREGALAVGRHPDGLPTAVRRVALALDQPAVLQLVEEPDELAAVVAERVRDRPLRLAGALVEDSQHGVVIRVQPRCSYASSARSLAAKPRRLSRNVVRGGELCGQPWRRARGEVSVVTANSVAQYKR